MYGSETKFPYDFDIRTGPRTCRLILIKDNMAELATLSKKLDCMASKLDPKYRETKAT